MRLVRLLLIAACIVTAAPAVAADWTSLKTDHFLLIGDASGRDIRDVALRFEQFRAAVTGAFPVLADDRPGPPVVVIVFRDQRSYEPYKPQFNGKAVRVGGYFIGGNDINYITLAADTRGSDFQTVYHEYTHLLMRRLAANLSAWVNEGLAEYFSTFDASGSTARFGRPLVEHVGLLRERQMPLLELFAVNHDSATYNEGNRRTLFYAQSWLVTHYAFIENQERWKQLVQFDSLVHNGQTPAAAFEQAVGVAPAVLEQELQTYVRRQAMQYQVFALDQRVATRILEQPTSMSEAEAHAWLGDLLAHAGRTQEATALLERALKASPELPLAHAAMGTLLLRQDKTNEAMAYL